MAKLDTSDSNSILQNILIIIVIIGIAYLIYYLYNNSSKMSGTDSMIDKKNVSNEQMRKPPMRQEGGQIGSVDYQMTGRTSGMSNPVMAKRDTLPRGDITGSENMEHFNADPNMRAERNLTSFPKEQLTADELLPQDNSSLWAQVNPSGVGSLKDRSFLQAGYNIGINTVGQTLRNANMQLRSEPANPQVVVSPFLQSTIEPDVSRKPFEIGGCM